MIESADFVGRPVRSLQTMLQVVLQGKENAPTIIPDGIYGRNTEAAVKFFQKEADLPVTGKVDNATWDRLVITYEDEIIGQGPAAPLLIVLQPGQVIEAEEWNYHMFLIQAMLAALARIYTDFPQVPVSGVLDANTQKSISHFQGVCGLPATGTIDKKTWQYLANHYAHAAGDGTEWAKKGKEK